MIGKPSKQKIKQFALQLQSKRNKIIRKHQAPIKLVLNHILNETINRYKFKKESDINKVISSYKPELQIILKNIYRQSFKEFGESLSTTIKKDDNNKKYCNLYFEKKQEFDEFELGINEDYDNFSNTHSNYILETLQKQFTYYDRIATKNYYNELKDKLNKLSDLEKSLSGVGFLVSINNFLYQKEMQKLRKEIQDYKVKKTENILNNFKDLIKENIINQSTERISTQEALFAESFTRQKEAEYIQEEQKKQVYKQWNSMFLETSRPSHIEASGQIKKVEENFMVRRPSTGEPEYGKEPKDENFSLDNKINCYCFLTYFIE